MSCDKHEWVLWGRDDTTGRYIYKCMRCGLIRVGAG